MFAVGSCAWQVGERLSPDAISMAVGVMFGTLAGLPVALLVMASNARAEERRRIEQQQQRATLDEWRYAEPARWSVAEYEEE